jgi:hypothetical protein
MMDKVQKYASTYTTLRHNSEDLDLGLFKTLKFLRREDGYSVDL